MSPRYRIMSHRSSHGDDVERGLPPKWLRFACILSIAGLFLAMIGYLCTVNRNAVAGYSMRVAEKRMAELSVEAQRLRIREAELRSLYGLEDASVQLGMLPVEGAVSLDVPGQIAYGK